MIFMTLQDHKWPIAYNVVPLFWYLIDAAYANMSIDFTESFIQYSYCMLLPTCVDLNWMTKVW